MEIISDLIGQSTSETSFSILTVFSTLGCAIILGLIISLTYTFTSDENAPSRSMVLSLVLIPAVMGMVIMIVGNNIVRVFSLAGTVSLIRYRSVPGDPKDIAYILLCAAAGLASGVGFYFYGTLGIVVLCILMFVLSKCNFGKTSSMQKILKVVVPEDLDYQDMIVDILEEFTTANVLSKVCTTDLGSLYEVVYRVRLKKGISEKDFIDKIRCRNGNLTVTLSLAPTEYRG